MKETIYNGKYVVVGQFAEVLFKEVDSGDAHWFYGIVERIFDDRIQLKLSNGKLYMHVTDLKDEEEEDIITNQSTRISLTFLYSNGKPVKAKKKLFGGYSFK